MTDTLDAVAPTSTVAPLPATEEDEDFTVSWSGQDDANGSGLASYSIYVSDNGGPFTPWLSDTTDTSATYDGQPGHTYAFYSVATDNAGNVESAPTLAEATTQVPGTSIDTTTTVQSSEVSLEPRRFGHLHGNGQPGEGSSTPTGSVQFSIDGATVGNSIALNNGSATFTTSALFVGSHSVTAAFTSDTGQFNPSSGTLTGSQMVNPAATTITVAPSTQTSMYGQSLTFTATVSPLSSGLPTPTGTVQFEIDGSVFGTAVTLVNGSATSGAIDSLGAGTHTITVVYSGDTNFTTSTSTNLTQTVNPAPLTVTANDATKIYGQPDPAFTASYSGFVLGQDPSALGGTLSLSTPATAASHVQAGGYPITPGGLTSTNYAITFVNGTLTITPAPLTITADDQSMVYGASLPDLTASYSGFVNGDTSANLATPVTLSTAATPSSPVGTYTIQASGAASADYLITFDDGTLTINQASTTTALVSSANPSIFGQSLTFTATVGAVAPSSGTPTGSVTFMDGSTSLGTITLSSGVATFSTTSLGVATHSITAVYSGDSNFVTSSSSTTETVNQASTTTSLRQPRRRPRLRPARHAHGDHRGGRAGGGHADGLCAVLRRHDLPGHRQPQRQYRDSHDDHAAGRDRLAHRPVPGRPQLHGQHVERRLGHDQPLRHCHDHDPHLLHQSFGLRPVGHLHRHGNALIGSGTPTGSVTFYAGSTPLGTATLSGKKASLKTTSVPVGSQAITAVYSGDTTYAPSTSAVLTQTVNLDSTTTKVTSSANPSVYGQSVTLTATVKAASPGSGTPTGTVTFYDGTTNLGSGTLSGGQPLFRHVLVIGSHSITAAYSGDTNFTASTSTALTQTVNQAGTTTAVVSVVNPSVYGQQLTFTATVSANSPGSGTPTGTITFYSGSTQLGTGTLSGGTASLTTSPLLSVGNRTIKASYSGDTNFKTSAGTLTQTVNQDSYDNLGRFRRRTPRSMASR